MQQTIWQLHVCEISQILKTPLLGILPEEYGIYGGGFADAHSSVKTLANNLLNDEQTQQTLIRNIISNMQLKGYQIIDVDFEYISPDVKNQYVSFIQRLKDSASIYGYSVWVALAPKTYAEQPGLLYEAHDYEALGRVADKVLLMTYEWGYKYGPPMAIAPLNKVKEVLDFALSVIPPLKIFLGVPNYGYDFVLPYEKGKSVATTISNTEAIEIATDNRSEILYDEIASSPYFFYTKDGLTHNVWFEDVRSIISKLELANNNGLYGIGYWNVMNFFAQNFAILNSGFNIVGK